MENTVIRTEIDKFTKGEELYFKSEVTRRHKVVFEKYTNNGKDAHVTFRCLGGEKNVLSLVSPQFLKRIT